MVALPRAWKPSLCARFDEPVPKTGGGQGVLGPGQAGPWYIQNKRKTYFSVRDARRGSPLRDGRRRALQPPIPTIDGRARARIASARTLRWARFRCIAGRHACNEVFCVGPPELGGWSPLPCLAAVGSCCH